MLTGALATYLAGQIADLTFDPDGVTGNVFDSTMPSTPDLAVMIASAGGEQQPDFTPERIPTPQILVRSVRWDPRPGLQLAWQILATLDGLDLVTLDPGGPNEIRLLGCTATQSYPVGIGMDSNDRHEWSLNFKCRTWEPTGLKPQV